MFKPSTPTQREWARINSWKDCGSFIDQKTGETLNEHWRAPDGTFWTQLPAASAGPEDAEGAD